MVDVEKCNNKECPKRKSCYRFTSAESMNQSWGEYKPDKDGKCDGYIFALPVA